MASVTAGGGGREIASVCGAGATGGRGTEGAELGTDGPAVKERLGCQSGKAVHDSSTSNDNPRIVAPNVRAETLPKRADAPMRCCVDPGACAANNAPESCPALLARRPGPFGGSVKPILLAQPRQYWAVSLLMVWHVPQMRSFSRSSAHRPARLAELVALPATIANTTRRRDPSVRSWCVLPDADGDRVQGAHRCKDRD